MKNQELLDRAAELQTEYWQAVRALEQALGIELDGEDLSGLTVEDLLAMVDGDSEETHAEQTPTS